MTAQAIGAVRFAHAADEAFDALVTASETMVIHQILIDRLGVAPFAQREFDEVEERLAGAGGGAPAGRQVESGDTWGLRWPVLHLPPLSPERVQAAVAPGRRTWLPSLAGFAAGEESGDSSLRRTCGRQAAPATWRPDRYAGRFQVCGGGLPVYAGLLLDAPQGPAQPPSAIICCLLLFVQDIAHVDGE